MARRSRRLEVHDAAGSTQESERKRARKSLAKCAGGELTAQDGSLYHFTRSFENLLGILEHDFLPRFCLEDIDLAARIVAGRKQSCSVPMVCFCDSPLSRLRGHMSAYGGYGIGLTKRWALKNGLSPVFYVDEHSQSYRVMGGFLHLLGERLSMESEQDSYRESVMWLIELASYVKPYAGMMARDGRHLPVTFYEEREWRYVPMLMTRELALLGDCPIRLTRREHLDPARLAEANESVARIDRLRFVPDDITYLFVRDESEIIPLVNAIVRIKGPDGARYDDDCVRLLTTRILPSSRIPLDF